MRLIDADALIHEYYKNPTYWNLCNAINSAPTIEERKAGRWELIEKAHGFPDWICSECGGSGRGDYFYCPNCGAVMREVEQ